MSSFMRKFSVRGKDANDKASEFDQLLDSGETILMTMTPTTTLTATSRQLVRVGTVSPSSAGATSSSGAQTVGPTGGAGRRNKNRDSLDEAMDKLTILEQAYVDQRAVKVNRPPVSNLSTGIAAATAASASSQSSGAPAAATAELSSQQLLKDENQRLETRIQELNSELFKERSTNSGLSEQLKEVLSQLEKIESQEALPSTPPDEVADLTIGGADDAEGDWRRKYQELEARSNVLSAKAVSTIKENKLKIMSLQRENLELKDQIRNVEDQLQTHIMEKSRAMSLIPRLVDMVKKLQSEINEEKKKRQLNSEFDDLTRVAASSRQSSFLSTPVGTPVGTPPTPNSGPNSLPNTSGFLLAQARFQGTSSPLGAGNRGSIGEQQ